MSGGDLKPVLTIPSWDRVPWLELNRAIELKLEDRPSPRILATHFQYPMMPKSWFNSKAKMLYVMRNPKDVFTSSYHYYKMATYLVDPGTCDEFLMKFLNGKVIFGSWFDHVKGWLNAKEKDSILYLTYEEMIMAITPPKTTTEGPSQVFQWQPVAASPPPSLKSADFPVLGGKLSKSEQKKLKEEAMKKQKSSTPVFKEAYHSQMREMHTSNMQDIEALQAGDMLGGGRRRVSVEEANSLATEFIRAIASEGEHVTIEKVISRICRHLRTPALQHCGIIPQRDLPAIKELSRTLREINIFIESLRAYMREQRAYRSKVDLAEFMQFVVDQYNCDSPYELGIRIQSVALSVSTLRKAQNSEHTSMDKARAIIEKEIEEEAQSKMRKIKKSLFDPTNGPQLFSTGGSIELRRKYASLTAAEVVLEVFNNAGGVFNKKMTKHVQDFLLRVMGDRLAMALFQLAICCGSLEVPQDLVAKEKINKPAEPKEQKNNVQPPSEAEVKQNLQKHLSNCNGILNLSYLSKIEKKILEHFKFEEFVNMDQGTFLEFLVKHSQILQEVGGAALVLSNQDSRICSYRPSQQDIYDLIRQCGVADQERFHDIESALRSHYKVKDSRELGYGSLATLVNIVQRQNKLHDGSPSNQTSLVCYEAALLIKDSRHGLSAANDAVGLLGDVSRDTALACLLNTPLLEDLADWSQWELVFEPQYGDLKDFIERNFGRKVTRLGDESMAVLADLLALEVKPGVLLRVTTHTSAELFAEAAMALDPVGTAGHLVSLVVADGIANAPLALLANHMETSLAAAGGQEEFSAIKEEAASLNISAKFILDCLVRIPTRLCKSLLQQVAKTCTRYQNRLHQMAILQGVTEWVKDFHMKLSPPKLPVVKSKVSKTRPQDAVSESSRSSVVALSEDEEFDVESSESESEAESDSDAPLASSGLVKNGVNIVIYLRKSEFGFGVLLNEEGKKLMEVHQNRLGRSLERLSTELYSKDTHFVLELIQNADDNCYPSDGSVHPSLVFVVERDCVTILNNECGFEERNIRAICDVGRSTKGKHTYGYIGQKGIGFKSVFKVTDFPEIHSNGFHICFDKNSGPMGYILPHWLEKERPLELDSTELQSSSWTTKIILPLRSESHQTRNLFHDVHPSLLLFLHRLRSISIVNQIKENVEFTELALAFKINNGENPLGLKLQPEKQPVFAFLPLRSFGFRFIIQGDFDIPSSREDVDRDSPWNQWLRSEVASLFLHAMDTFTEHPDFEGLQGLCEFLQFIPLPDEIFDFFKPVAGQIIQLLKGKACLPTKEDQDGDIEFKLPSQIAVSQDVLIQEVICPELLHRHLNLSYLNPAVQSALPSSLISALGVHRLTGSDITTVTFAMAKEMIEDNGTYHEDSLKKIAKLLVCNFRSLEQEYGAVDCMLQALKSIPIIPLADGRMVSLNGPGVFFPLCDSQNAQTGEGLEAIYKDINTVNPKLLECLDPLSNSQVKELLKKLDVHDLEPEKVILEHIVPILKKGYWKEKPEDIVISYVVFIKQHSNTQGLSKLKAFFPVLTNKGFVCPYERKVQFSKEYGNIDLPSKLPGVDWVLLHPCYLRADADLSGWRELFSVLGVQDLLIFRKEKRSLTKKELASSPWALDNEFWQKTTDDVYVIEDCECEEFHSLVTADHLSEKEKIRQREELLSLLDRNWDTGGLSDNSHLNQVAPLSKYFKGIKSSISVEDVITLFKSWCCKNTEGNPGEFEGANFITTVDHIYNVYLYLYENCKPQQLKTLFQQTPAVFVEYESQVCLLNLPAAELKPIFKAKTSSKQGKHIQKEKVFDEDLRALFLEICGVRNLSQCISVEAQTENYRPCPSVQRLVRKVVPDIQKFIYQDFRHIHNELKENNIAGLLKSLSFGQVGKLYIQYQLTLPDMDPLYEKEDVICLLKDKQLYIQKDHIRSHIDICREVVKLFSMEDKDFGKELERFLQGLMSCLDDEAALKRFLHKEDISDLPENEEKWEVPKPLEIEQETKGHRIGDQLHRALSTNEEKPKEAAEDGEKTLACWPPKSSMNGVAYSPSGQAADTVMKMWPPPAQPSPLTDTKVYFNTHGNSEVNDTGVQASKLPDPQLQDSSQETGQNQQLPAENTEADQRVPSNASLSNHQPPVGPAVYSVFQGSDSLQRPPLPLDCPVWAQRQPHEALLEDLTIKSSVSGPQAVVFTEDTQDSTAIGEWGERLVYAFLLDWKENGIHNRPREIVWNNRNGESGQPCDFKVTFATDDGVLSEVYIEVKATVKVERSFIHLSANELHLALKEKERYHIYRVYNAGDTRHVRLCRIKNLAQCLHAKELELFLFV
ncbi:UNVERIFIED_CONTAM: hypothetical protein FKN15_023719 [Acipenser sinensis]